jgi:hypothetical protein
MKAGVVCPIDLAHPAGSERRDDLILSESRADGERHGATIEVERSKCKG